MAEAVSIYLPLTLTLSATIFYFDCVRVCESKLCVCALLISDEPHSHSITYKKIVYSFNIDNTLLIASIESKQSRLIESRRSDEIVVNKKARCMAWLGCGGHNKN